MECIEEKCNITITKNLDKLGRITLPASIRKSLGIDINMSIAQFIDGKGNIILEKDNGEGEKRKLDALGRLVIIKELRRLLDINDDDLVDIRVKYGKIIISKHVYKCSICNSSSNTIDFKGKKICLDCINKIKNIINESMGIA